jgi:hypothetical protein
MSEYEEDDGLSSFDLRQLGGKVGAFGGARLMKFAQGDFIAGAEKIGPEREFITFGLTKVVQKFVNKQLMDMKVVAPHDDFPDIEAMNEAAPKEEWGIGLDGKPQGPYQHLLILKLLEAETFDRFAFITRSMGGGAAIGDLTSKCKIARRIHGPDVTALVTCQWTRWPTKYNPHGKRPDFRVKKWVPLDGNKELMKPVEPAKAITAATTVPSASAPPTTEPAAAPATKASAETAPPAAPASPTAASASSPSGLSLKTMSEPTLAQEMEDEVPFNSSNKS